MNAKGMTNKIKYADEIAEIFMAFEPYQRKDLGLMTPYVVTKVRLDDAKKQILSLLNKVAIEAKRGALADAKTTKASGKQVGKLSDVQSWIDIHLNGACAVEPPTRDCLISLAQVIQSELKSTQKDKE